MADSSVWFIYFYMLNIFVLLDSELWGDAYVNGAALVLWASL